MKIVLFLVCMLMCGMSFAEPLASLSCTDGYVQHKVQGDSDDHTILYIDGNVYNIESDKTMGDWSYTRYHKEDDINELAFLTVELYEDESQQEVKLVLMRHGDHEASFGALCTYD